MKMRARTVAFVILFLPVLLSARDAVRTDTISVPHMQCGMCEMTISKRLKKIDGVTEVEADAEANTVVVTWDPSKTSLMKLRKAIAEAGYDADAVKTTPEAQAKLHGCCRPTGD